MILSSTTFSISSFVQVTIVGQSAGAMSAFLHLLSPSYNASDNGLPFRAAIMQSGVPTTPFCATDKHPAYYARYIICHLILCF